MLSGPFGFSSVSLLKFCIEAVEALIIRCIWHYMPSGVTLPSPRPNGRILPLGWSLSEPVALESLQTVESCASWKRALVLLAARRSPQAKGGTVLEILAVPQPNSRASERWKKTAVGPEIKWMVKTRGPRIRWQAFFIKSQPAIQKNQPQMCRINRIQKERIRSRPEVEKHSMVFKHQKRVREATESIRHHKKRIGRKKKNIAFINAQ